MSMQSIQKELRTLKQEEMTLINLASKFSDQLNRLKVEELALQNLVRLQNEEQEKALRGSERSFLSSNTMRTLDENEDDVDMEEIELDLNVRNPTRMEKWNVEEVEEEEEEENENRNEVQDIEEFVEQLS